jgi:Spy/CpxP family protein refolding chaperone
MRIAIAAIALSGMSFAAHAAAPADAVAIGPWKVEAI